MFPMGFHKLIMWDYEGPGVDSEEVMEATRNNRRMMLRRFRLSSRTSDNVQEGSRQCSLDADEVIGTKDAADADSGEKRVDTEVSSESSRKRSGGDKPLQQENID